MHIDIRALADAIGYPAAALGILIESAGIPFPGETMLLAVAAYAAQGRLDIQLVVALGAAGALLGANFGYAIGYFGGRPFVERMGRFLRIGPSHFARSELFFARYGGMTVLFARFVLGLRTWASVMAGMSRMPFWTFQLFSAIGGVAWAIVIGAVGFTLGANWSLVDRLIRYLGVGGLVLVAAVILGALLLRRRAAHT
ncbi:MAG TPA: DedA family protein [Candidatus Dormibacteraeota bacterium]|nr:DedA family protein [Candidatus Dormibacteraeota bacterium]